MNTFSASAYKLLPHINVIPNQRTVCVYNTIGQKVCYQLPRDNEILCDQENCKISFQSPNQTYLGKTFPSGVNIGLRPRGAFASVHIFGIFPKAELSNVMNNFDMPPMVKNVPNIPNPTFDLPDPPKSCRWAVWSDDCRPYVESANWGYSLRKGWKKVVTGLEKL